jgi:sterol desaturase/sphingolipid hydroxylase (fatty acid hydroxylase superfamily)
VLIIFIMPSHPMALLVFQTISTVINVYGHLGYEVYPRNWPQHWLGRWLNTSVAHNAHHDRARHNYGFYFLFWDRWMGTLAPDYEAVYREKLAV